MNMDASTSSLVMSGVVEPRHSLRMIRKLEDLLNPDRLESECHTLANTMRLSPPKIKDWKEAVLHNDKFEDWLAQNQVNFALSTWVSAAGKDSFGEHHLQLRWMTLNATRLPKLTTEMLLTSVNARLTTWELGRILVQTYLWHTEHSPKLSGMVIKAFRDGRLSYDQIKEAFPYYAELAAHILHYTFSRRIMVADERNKAKNPKKEGTSRNTYNAKRQTPLCFGDKPGNVEVIPGDLYGLLGESKAPAVLKCSSFLGKQPSFRSLDDVYEKAETIFQSVLRDALLVPHLHRLDSIFQEDRKRRATDAAGVWHRCVARGALLDILAKVVGTDSIFASADILSLIVSPYWVYREKLILGTDISSPSAFVKFIARDPAIRLEPLKNWIASHIDGNGHTERVKEAASDLGSLLHEFVVGQEDGAAGKGKKVLRSQVKQVFRLLQPQEIKSSASPIRLSVLGLIVQEALNNARSLPYRDEGLRRILVGEDPFTRRNAKYNPDQTNPFRHANVATELFKRHLADHVGKPEWLSNALAWMGTGQGVKTQRFLEQLSQPGFFCNTLEDQVLMFENVLEENARRVLKHKGRPGEETLNGWFYTSDSQIWGQSSNHLKLFPTVDGREMTLGEKLGQYWSPDIIARWSDWYSQAKEKRTWKGALEFLYSLHIRGFQSGLTVFQLANNMALLDIVSMPEAYDIADWIHDNAHLGASGGLKFLGFHMDTCGAVRCAFDCVFSHLDQYMTDADKKLAGFGTIFVEHILCKIVRWADRYGKDDQGNLILGSLSQKATQEQQALPWVSGENSTNHLCLPFPVEVSEELIGMVMNRYNVSLYYA